MDEKTNKGYWEIYKTAAGDEYTVCSNCKNDFSFRTEEGNLVKLNMREANFCPNCGTDMREN